MVLCVSKVNKYRNALNLGEYRSSDFLLQIHLVCCLQFQTCMLLKESSSVPTTNSEMWLWGKLVWEQHQNPYPFETVLWTTTVIKLQCSWAQAKAAAWLTTSPASTILGSAGAHTTAYASVSGPGTELQGTDQLDSKRWSLLDWSRAQTFCGGFSLCSQDCLTVLMVLKCFFQIWRTVRFYFVFGSSMNRTWVWDK